MTKLEALTTIAQTLLRNRIGNTVAYRATVCIAVADCSHLLEWESEYEKSTAENEAIEEISRRMLAV